MKFVNLRNGEVQYGFTMYDDYDGSYNAIFESEPPSDDMEFLKMVLTGLDEKMQNMIDFVVESQNGLYIGDSWYDWSEIKDILCPIEETV